MKPGVLFAPEGTVDQLNGVPGSATRRDVTWFIIIREQNSISRGILGIHGGIIISDLSTGSGFTGIRLPRPNFCNGDTHMKQRISDFAWSLVSAALWWVV